LLVTGCRKPQVIHGNAFPDTQMEIPTGSEITIACDTGYALFVGMEQTQICLPSGKFSNFNDSVECCKLFANYAG